MSTPLLSNCCEEVSMWKTGCGAAGESSASCPALLSCHGSDLPCVLAHGWRAGGTGSRNTESVCAIPARGGGLLRSDLCTVLGRREARGCPCCRGDSCSPPVPGRWDSSVGSNRCLPSSSALLGRAENDLGIEICRRKKPYTAFFP